MNVHLWYSSQGDKTVGSGEIGEANVQVASLDVRGGEIWDSVLDCAGCSVSGLGLRWLFAFASTKEG